MKYMNQLTKLKIKSIKQLDCIEKVYDLSVENFNHYIDKNGIVHHNSGLYYSASTVAFMSKAKLKDGSEDDMDLGQSGVVVTLKTEKNRLAKPKKIKFNISFVSGCNPFVGLDAFCIPKNFESVGIGQGKWEKYPTPKEVVDKETGEVTLQTGKFIAGGNRWYVRHLESYVNKADLFSAKVFNDKVLQALEPIINDYFKYKSIDELNEINKQYDEEESDHDNDEEVDLFE